MLAQLNATGKCWTIHWRIQHKDTQEWWVHTGAHIDFHCFSFYGSKLLVIWSHHWTIYLFQEHIMAHKSHKTFLQWVKSYEDMVCMLLSESEGHILAFVGTAVWADSSESRQQCEQYYLTQLLWGRHLKDCSHFIRCYIFLKFDHRTSPALVTMLSIQWLQLRACG